ASPGIPHQPAILVLPSQEILLGQPYRRLASRYPPDHSSSDHFSSDDSLSDSLSDSSSDFSSGHSLPDSSFSSWDSSFDTPATISARPSRKRFESVGSSTSRIILFGTTPSEIHVETLVIPPVSPEVEAARVASPAGVLELTTYSSDGPMMD
nr:hypothetical protein [Tanacetum cinerariifolium]